jgi:hypothetical protein
MKLFWRLLNLSMAATVVFAILLISLISFADNLCLAPQTVFYRNQAAAYSFYTLSDGRAFWSKDIYNIGDKLCLK